MRLQTNFTGSPHDEQHQLHLYLVERIKCHKHNICVSEDLMSSGSFSSISVSPDRLLQRLRSAQTNQTTEENQPHPVELDYKAQV